MVMNFAAIARLSLFPILCACTAADGSEAAGTVRTASALEGASAGAGLSPKLSSLANFVHTPFFRQQTDSTCGVAALQSVLGYYGDIDSAEPAVARELGSDDTGTRYKAMIRYAEARGYRTRVKKDMTVADLEAHIARREPVIVLIQAWPDSPVDWVTTWDNGHYVVATGFDDDRVYFMDPWVRSRYAYIAKSEFVDRWHDVDGDDGALSHFGLIIDRAAGPHFDFDVAIRAE